jgi:hypothetical protein
MSWLNITTGTVAEVQFDCVRWSYSSFTVQFGLNASDKPATVNVGAAHFSF